MPASKEKTSISVFGLGYVGCVCCGCFAELGSRVIGFDTNTTKLDLINSGKATILEDKVDALIGKHVATGSLAATSDAQHAVWNTEVSILCVGTPSTEKGHLDLECIFDAAAMVGEALRQKDDFHTVAIRSTVLPGTNRKVTEIIEERSGKKSGVGFGVVSNPEFLREATAVDDFMHPAHIIIGDGCEQARQSLKAIYAGIDAPIREVSTEAAEILKYVNNAFHALKISFTNEVGRICKETGIDAREVMSLVVADKILNISPYYMKPGFAYGGSCLPKDLKALKTISHDNYVTTPIIDSIRYSNVSHIISGFRLVTGFKKKNVGIIGLSFKPGTDDLRNSPTVELVEKLSGKGYWINIFDRDVEFSALAGKNKEYIDSVLPHLSVMLNERLNDVVDQSEVIVVTKNEDGLSDLVSRHPEKVIVDLVGLAGIADHPNYHGICW